MNKRPMFASAEQRQLVAQIDEIWTGSSILAIDAIDVRDMGVDALVRALLDGAADFDVRRALAVRIDDLGLAHLVHASDCDRTRSGACIAGCRWERGPALCAPSLESLPAAVVGAHVRRLRVHRGLTQLQLAARAGVTDATLRGIESGSKRPHRTTTRAIARALDVSIEEIVAAVRREAGEVKP
jgi:DNA-binding XRE family transcriptional regulator